MIRILTDSTSSIPPQLRSDLGIDTISLHVNYNGQEFEEATMDLDAFYADIYDMKNNPPTSSQPSPAAISAYLEEAAAADDQVIATCLSSRMSGTFESVVSIAAQVKERHPQFTYAVIDSTTNCMELGLPVIAGARQRNQGATFDQCVAAIRDAIHSTRFLFAPESLKFLEAGGRIGKAAALLGSLVKISPVLTVKDGAAETFAKVRTYKKEEDPESANAALWTLKTVLTNALKLLHPYMPFITEEIFCTLQSKEETIMLSQWPEYTDAWNFPEEESAIERCKDLVKGVRNVRTEMDVPPSRKAKLFVVSENADVREVFDNNREVYVNLAFTSEITVQADKSGIGEDAVSVVIPDAVVYLPLEDLVDFEKEKERLNKEKEKLTKELARSRGMLSNEKFLSNAKPEKVEEEKAKLAKYEQMMAQVEERLAQMK